MDLDNIRKILEKDEDEAVSDVLSTVEERYGEVPYILNFMKDMPELLIPKVMYDNSIMREFERLDPETIELICVGVASALRCDHCLKMHIRVARRLGLTREQIFDAILIGGAISNASVLAEGTRALDDEVNGSSPSCDSDCDSCNITGSDR
ncbi:carboxymuconolactone decarboxylase family protein [Methanohalophilus mahii]|uniref:Alkylhydroperoxidase like protein, AhpD family n=1 Tax=Methanohalophilus mahii (strain ATCC 35705 / DSM 5219 / SLP) TaxID=547558 RepID=D5E856_METMS|nr:carboxymuconolactone decarboxylase family protein [Methanohalophilus mahii]ADE37344.1 alkylhydroperoxidase like protein, AhpD family [Methanohalophilus mahii DSM 5219]